jgi:dihydrofolate reductase
MLMGRNSMEMVMGFIATGVAEWPYEGKRVVVLSNTLKQAPAQLADKVELYSGSLTELAQRLEHEGCKRLYIDGGKTIQSFLHEGLITDLTITTIPVLLGEGLPLFGNTGRDIKLKHVKTEAYASGFVQSSYEI